MLVSSISIFSFTAFYRSFAVHCFFLFVTLAFLFAILRSFFATLRLSLRGFGQFFDCPSLSDWREVLRWRLPRLGQSAKLSAPSRNFGEGSWGVFKPIKRQRVLCTLLYFLHVGTAAASANEARFLCECAESWPLAADQTDCRNF